MGQILNMDDAKMMMANSAEGTLWVLVEVDDTAKVGKDERRRVLMHPDMEVLQSNIPVSFDNYSISGEGIEVYPATPDSKRRPHTPTKPLCTIAGDSSTGE